MLSEGWPRLCLLPGPCLRLPPACPSPHPPLCSLESTRVRGVVRVTPLSPLGAVARLPPQPAAPLWPTSPRPPRSQTDGPSHSTAGGPGGFPNCKLASSPSAHSTGLWVSPPADPPLAIPGSAHGTRPLLRSHTPHPTHQQTFSSVFQMCPKCNHFSPSSVHTGLAVPETHQACSHDRLLAPPALLPESALLPDPRLAPHLASYSPTQRCSSGRLSLRTVAGGDPPPNWPRGPFPSRS